MKTGAAAVPRPRDRLRIDLDMRPPRALPTAHFYRNESHVIYGTGHWKSPPSPADAGLRRDKCLRDPESIPIFL
jgi:hypothetical protein